MFDIAWSELLLIAVVALIFIGPKELPQVLHNLGRMTAKLRRSADDFRRQFEDSVRESGYEDLHKNLQEFRSLNPASQLKDSIARAINQDYPPKAAAPEQAPLQESMTVGKLPHPDPQHVTAPMDADPSRQSPASEGAQAPAAEGAQVPSDPLAQATLSSGASGTKEPADAAAEPSKDRIAPAA